MTVILSDLLKGKKKDVKQQNGTRSDVGKRKKATKDVITTVKDYERLTEATGGLLISAAKFDVNDIVGIMGSGVETSTVRPMMQDSQPI